MFVLVRLNGVANAEHSHDSSTCTAGAPVLLMLSPQRLASCRHCASKSCATCERATVPCGQHAHQRLSAAAVLCTASCMPVASEGRLPVCLQVVLNGSQSMHAVSDEGVSVRNAAGDEVLQIKTWDTALVSPGHPTPFPQGLKQSDLKEGVHFNLANNVWGTNYVSRAVSSSQLASC